MFFLNWVERREGKRSGNLKADEASGSLALRRELCTNLAATASPRQNARGRPQPGTPSAAVRAAPRPTPGTSQPWHRTQLADALEPKQRQSRGLPEGAGGCRQPRLGRSRLQGLLKPFPFLLLLCTPGALLLLCPQARAPTERRFPPRSSVSQRSPSGRRSPWKLPLPPLAGEGPGWGLRRAPALVRQGQHCDTATAGLRRNSERLWGDEITALRDGISKLH